MMKNKVLWVLGCMFVAGAALAQIAQSMPPPSSTDATQLRQLVDYVAVDYGDAVANGAVVSEVEYAEMRDFTDKAYKQAQALPAHADKDAIVGAIDALRVAVLHHADGTEVSRAARHANNLLIAAYPLTEAAAAEGIPVDAVTAGKPSGLGLARARLQESLAALRAGDQEAATRLGLSAYLDGFEPIEPALGARNKALLTEVENAMLAYRSAVTRGTRHQAESTVLQLDHLFAQVESELGAGSSDPMTTFVGALTILLREGVEALLIVVGMVAFLKKAQRSDVLRYVHAGWIAALAAGALTWVVATHLVGISGASREVTEGLSSWLAAIVLLSVGLWMHQKSSAGRWQAYLKDKLSAAMSRRSAWALLVLSFIVVYREVFETVLFYSALAADGNSGALLAGMLSGVVLLTVIAWLLLRTSARMPIGKFFSLSSVLVAILAVVLAGKGLAGLQEAGWVDATPVLAPRIDVLGMYPTAETMLAQFVVLLIASAGFGFNLLKARSPQTD